MARTTFSYLGVLILLASCGSSSGADGSGSGTGGAGGASGGGTGGTGGASSGGTGGASSGGSAGTSIGGQSGAGGQGGSGGLRPTPMGGVSLFVTSTASTPSSSFCKQYPNWVNVPFSVGHDQSFGPTKTGTRAVDGEREMDVQCAVTMAGSAFAVTGHLNSPALGLDNNRLPPTDVTVEVTVANDQANAVGKISLTDDLRTGRYESTDCTFSVLPQAPGELLGVAAGRVAATVSCPNLRSTVSASVVCQITQGYVILENCTQ